MRPRDQRIYDEAVALWQAVFGAPPPPEADGSELLQRITSGLPGPNYQRLTSPFLRPSTIVGPGQPTDEASLG